MSAGDDGPTCPVLRYLVSLTVLNCHVTFEFAALDVVSADGLDSDSASALSAVPDCCGGCSGSGGGPHDCIPVPSVG